MFYPRKHISDFMLFIAWAASAAMSVISAKMYYNEGRRAFSDILLVSGTHFTFGTVFLSIWIYYKEGSKVRDYIWAKEKTKVIFQAPINFDCRNFKLAVSLIFGQILSNVVYGGTSASLNNVVSMSSPIITAILMVLTTTIKKLRVNLSSLSCVLIFNIFITVLICDHFIRGEQYSWVIVKLLLGHQCALALGKIIAKYSFENDDISSSPLTIKCLDGVYATAFFILFPSMIYIILFDDNISSPFETSITSFSITTYIISSLTENFISYTFIISRFNPIQHSLLEVGRTMIIILVYHVFLNPVWNPFIILASLECASCCLEGVNTIITDSSDNDQDEKNREKKITKADLAHVHDFMNEV